MVYPSNPPLEYGNSIGGIVDLSTTESLTAENETTLSLSSANLGVFHSRQLNDKSFIQLYGNGQWSGLYKGINPSSLDYLNKFGSTDIGVNFRTAITSRSYINEYAYLTNETYSAENGMYNFTGKQRANSLRNFNILNYRLHTDKGVWGINLGWDITNSKYYYGAISDTTRQKNLFVSTSYKHYFPNGLTVSIGGDYEYNLYRFHGVYPHIIYAVGDLNSTTNHAGKIRNNKVETFVYAKWKVNNFILSTSVRNILLKGEPVRLSYQANIKYNLSPTNAFILSSGKYNALSIPDYYIRNMKNATSRQLSLDWKYTPLPKSEFSAAVYWKKESIPLYLANIANDLQTDNKVIGFELYGKHNWRHFEISGSYTFLDTKMTYNGKSYATDNRFGHMVKSMISYIDHRMFNASISCLYRGGLPYTPVVGSQDRLPVFGTLNSAKYNGYLTVDFSANKYIKCGKVGIIPFITITNITNKKNQYYFYYNDNYSTQYTKYYQLRLFYIGCSVKF